MYGYAGNDPFNKHDPLGLYEGDVHHYLTTYLAEAAGFDVTTAEAIGRETFDLDIDEIRGGMLAGRAHHGNMDTYHFVSRTQFERLKSKAFRGRRYGGYLGPLAGDQLVAVAEYLHALEDTYSHQKNRKIRSYGDYYESRPFNKGHAYQGHTVDWTWTSPELALQMAEEVYYELVVLCRQYQRECTAKSFDSLRETIEAFVRYEPETQRQFVYLSEGKKFGVTRSVLDYTSKIQILDPTYALTEAERNAQDQGWVDSEEIQRLIREDPSNLRRFAPSLKDLF